MDQVDEAVRGGTRAVFAAQIVSQLVTVAALAVLYRFISRSDYGLLGMALPLVMLPRMLATLGLSAATIQREKLQDTHVSALFWLNLLLGLAAAGLTIVLGFWLSSVYGAAELTGICLVLSGTSLVAVLGTQHQALLERKLKIRQLALLRIGGQTAAAVAAIIAAVAGAGIWALVLQQYVDLLVITVGVWTLERWRPGKLPPRGELKSLMAFGGYYSLSTLMFYLAQNVDKIVLSVTLGSTKAGQQFIGMYTQAYQMMMKPVYLVTTPITGIMLPGLSRAAAQRSLFVQMVGRFYRMVAIMLLPCGIGLWVVGIDLMTLLGGVDWRPAGLMLAALCPTILTKGFINIAGSVLAAIGRADRLFFGSVAVALLMTQAVLGGYFLARLVSDTPLAATIGVGLGVSAATAIVIGVPYLIYCLSIAGIRLRSLAPSLRGSLLSAALMGVLVWSLRQLLLSLQLRTSLVLLISVAAGVGIYLALARQEISWLLKQLGWKDAGE